jgi:hypothetical protein
MTHQVFTGRLLIALLRRTFRGYLLPRTQNWLTVRADDLQDNSSSRTPRKTRPILLRNADRTENTAHVIPTKRIYWRADRCLATSYQHFFYCCVFTISLPNNRNTLPLWWAIINIITRAFFKHIGVMKRIHSMTSQMPQFMFTKKRAKLVASGQCNSYPRYTDTQKHGYIHRH